MKKSKLFSTNWRDVLYGAITAGLAVATTALVATLEHGAIPTLSDFKVAAAVFLGTMAAYIIKNFLSNSAGQFGKGEDAADSKKLRDAHEVKQRLS